MVDGLYLVPHSKRCCTERSELVLQLGDKPNSEWLHAPEKQKQFVLR